MKITNIQNFVFGVVLCLVLMVSSQLLSQESSGKVEGLIFTNWHYNLNKDVDQSNAFDVLRAYFGYKYTINEKFMVRVTMDVGRVNTITSVKVDSPLTVSTKTDQRLEAYLKYAYLEWKDMNFFIPIILMLCSY